jgi:3-hydroxyisobutyrate dehydrogenase/putative dehydrogenase
VTGHSTAVPEVGVVGLGAMGLPMAAAVARELSVVGVDPSAGRRELAERAGIGTHTEVAAVAPARSVLVMVSSPAQLTAVLDAAETLDVSGQLWLLAGTYGPEPVAEAADRLGARGATVVDCPVTGGVRGAETASLLLFCSGAPSALERAEPLLGRVGDPRRVGDRPGDGQRVKAINQHLCSIHLVAAAEAVALAEHSGLDASTVLDLLVRGAAHSWMLADRGPLMLHPPDEPRSTVDVFVKDAGIAASLADASGADVPVLRAAMAQYLRAAEAGLAGQDDSRVVETYRSLSTSRPPRTHHEGLS